MSLSHIGPVAVEVFNPEFSWGSTQDVFGFRGASVSGLVEWPQAQQLSELVANPHRRITVGGVTGVLEYVWAGDSLLAPFRGWYLLGGFTVSPSQIHSMGGLSAPVPFSLDATFLGERQVVVTRSARSRTNGFSVIGKAVVADPFWDDETFLVSPGGTAFTRAYDATAPYVSPVTTPAARTVNLNVATVTTTTDGLSSLVVPALAPNSLDTPTWVTERGGDVRSYDRRDGREVYGPSHPFRTPTDLLVTNGLFRFWVGNQGLPPFVNCQAFVDSVWQSMGVVSFAPNDTANTLSTARLVSLTPERAMVALDVRNAGQVLLTLRRGERMLRVQHGSTRSPQVTVHREVGWRGMPPTKRLAAAFSAPAKFGNGLEGGEAVGTNVWNDPAVSWSDADFSWEATHAYGPDVSWLWPPTVPNTEWTMALWWRPTKASGDQGESGLLAIRNSAETVNSVRIRYLPIDATIRADIGTTTLISSPLTFAAGSDIFIAVRLSPTHGKALSVKATTVQHVANANTTPGGGHHSILVGGSESTWGQDSWGDLAWGGSVIFPAGDLDNLQVFEDWLTDAEVATLSDATAGLGGLPKPESRLVWHAPFDTHPNPVASSQASGRRYEATALSGTTRRAELGLTKAVVALSATAVQTGNFALGGPSSSLDVAAILATTATNDDLANHHEQFVAAAEQEVRVR